MPHIYATEADATSPHTLPNIWVTQLTADEVAESPEGAWKARQGAARREFGRGIASRWF
jgi:hypothetical protein